MVSSETTRPRVTLKQVAEHAGVSQATASTVMSGVENGIRLTPSTIERVHRSASALGYRSRDRARGQVRVGYPSYMDAENMLASGKLFAPAIILKHFETDPSSSEEPESLHHDIAAAFEIVASSIPGTATRSFNRNRKGQPPFSVEVAVESLLANGANAIMLIDFDWLNVVEGFVPILSKSGVPFVIVSAGPLALPVANICYDNRASGFQAAAHLIQQGHRNFAFIATTTAEWTEARIEGAMTAIRHFGLPAEAIRVLPEERLPISSSNTWTQNWTHFQESKEIARRGFNEGTIPGAVIAANDETALGVMEAASELGISIPGDLAIIGFDDTLAAKSAGLSTLRAPREEMGRQAAKMLHKIFTGERASSQICLRSDLIARTSSMQTRR